MFGICISRQLAHVIVKRLGFTYKRTRKRGILPAKRGCCNDFFQAMIRHRDNIVAIDESGFDQRPVPIYGYTKAGQPAIVEWKPSSDRRRLNLLMCIHVDGSCTKVVHDKPINSQTFVDFVRGMPYKPGTAMLLDNASIHKTKAALACMADKGYHPIFLPPYSPEYNPIELVFGAIKNAFYRARYLETSRTLDSMVDDCVVAKALSPNILSCFEHVYGLVHKELDTRQHVE